MERYNDLQESLRMSRPSRTPWVLFVLALLAGAAVAVFLLYRLDAARTAAGAAAAEKLDAQEKLAQLRASRAEMEQRLERLEAEKSDLLALKNDLARDVQAKEEELQKLKGTYDELQEKMKAEIAKGEIRLSQAGGRLKVDMVDKVLFESGEADITKRGEEVLSRVGSVLARIEDKQIQVSGHTDDAPISSRLTDKFPTNWELSTARATRVVRFLQEKASVPARRLVATGYGPYHPIATNATPGGRARNRRIEILLTPSLEPTPARIAAPAKAAPKAEEKKPAAAAKKAAAKK
ncbi:MAG TPA: OmpA family protein [Anaeromyxobacteraceae bacterium]|nr:OmpA family protein [Anaeromyxobacteraceae bacterium]